MSTLLVASTGGHLKELHELQPRLQLSEPVRWVTFDTEQSRSLLAGQRVDHVAYTGQRDVRHVLTNVPAALRLMRRHRPGLVVSTGSAVALSFLPAARALGAGCHYIESAARASEPSLTGRLLTRVPGVHLYTQSAAAWGPRWRFGGSVFDAFAAGVRPGRVTPRRVVVTLGTMPFGFRRLVLRLTDLLDPHCEVLWQVGSTDVRGLGVQGVTTLPARELDDALRQADLVISHAGIGSALAALEAGHCPVLVPRERAYGEHVDDHQLQIASDLSRRGLAVSSPVPTLTTEHLERAAAQRVTRADPPAFRLCD